jgi:hypothetical protein
MSVRVKPWEYLCKARKANAVIKKVTHQVNTCTKATLSLMVSYLSAIIIEIPHPNMAVLRNTSQILAIFG